MSEPGSRSRAAVSMTVFRQAMSSSAVRPVASAASNIEPGSVKPLSGQRPDEALVAARGAGAQVVDRLEDGPDGAGRGDLGDRPRTARPAGDRSRRPRGARVVDRSRTSGRGACSSTGPRRPGGRATRGRGPAAGPALIPAENETVCAAPRPTSAVEAGRQQPADQRPSAPSASVSGQDERELVATDPERPVGAAHVGGHRRRRLAQDQVAGGVAARVVDPLEVVEVEDRERQRAAVPGRAIDPLALDLLLEGAVVAEAGQRVAQRLRAGPVVGVLEDAPGLARGARPARARDAPARRSAAQDEGQEPGCASVGTSERRAPIPRGQPVDDRRRDRDRDREHRDEREEQAETDEAKVRRLA